MQFDVVFMIDAKGPDAAAEEVGGWTVTPGAVLKYIISSQPVTVTSVPQVVPESGHVGEIEVADPDAMPPMMPQPMAPAQAATNGEEQPKPRRARKRTDV
jgi:hypothetical protein